MLCDPDVYRSALPFPHCVTRLADSEALAEAADSWPADGWRHYRVGKHANQAVQSLRLHADLSSPAFVADLEAMTGIPRLLVDPEMFGGGLHQTDPGGKLGLHVDFNCILRSGERWYRRLNLLVFLNRGWAGRNGDLELWSDLNGKPHERVVAVTPEYGTCVVFTTSERSWHGHPRPLESDAPRRSFAMYYYTRERPDEFAGEHTTVYAEK